MRRVVALAIIVAGLMPLAACGDPEPIKIGFIGGLGGRGSDLGIAARNAMQMATDEANAKGGINGRPIELLVRDDAGTDDGGAAAARSLVSEGVAAIIGPNLGVVAKGMLPIINEAKIVTVSPTVSSLEFVGKNDYFYRIGSTTRQYAAAYARLSNAAGYKRVAVALDARNEVFSDSWLAEFRAALSSYGGEVTIAQPFDATIGGELAEVVDLLLATSSDAVIFIANGIDSAQLSQQVRKVNAQIPMLAVEWAASEGLIELGGRAIEGLVMLQTYDRYDQQPRFTGFRNKFTERFRSEPGFASIAAYDGATVLFAALRNWNGSDDLKTVMDAMTPVEGLQQSLAFDKYGDSARQLVFVSVRNGKFIRQ